MKEMSSMNKKEIPPINNELAVLKAINYTKCHGG